MPKLTHMLRALLLVLIVLNIIVASGHDPISLAQLVGTRISRAVGVGASVAPNPYNSVALQLKEKERSLGEHERELAAREKKLDKELVSQKTIIAILTGFIFVMFIMLLLNFYNDHKRNQKK